MLIQLLALVQEAPTGISLSELRIEPGQAIAQARTRQLRSGAH